MSVRSGLPFAFLGLFVIVMLIQGIQGVVVEDGFYDFQCFWRAARAVWSPGAQLYPLTADDGRSFLYPPPSALVLAPIALLPESVAGIAWTLVKLALLAATARALHVWALREGWLTKGRGPWVFAIVALVLYTPFRSDFDHGQINALLLAFAMLGAALAFEPGESRAGRAGTLLAAAALIKVTPGLFAGALLLHRRWRALALFIGVALALCAFATAWLGPEVWSAWSDHSSGRIRSGRLGNDVRSLAEVFTWAIAQVAGPDAVPEQRAWLLLLGALGAAYLAVRHWRVASGRPCTPLWDVAALGTGVVLVNPMARLAQEVALLPAAMLLVAHVARGVLPRWPERADAPAITALAILLIGESVFKIGNHFGIPVLRGPDFSPLLATLLVYGAIVVLPAPLVLEVAGRAPPKRYATPTPTR